MIIYLILLPLIILVIKNIYELHQFDHSSELIQLQNPNHVTIKELVLKRSPIVIHNLVGKYNDISSLTIDTLIQNNPGYIINDNGNIYPIIYPIEPLIILPIKIKKQVCPLNTKSCDDKNISL